MKDKTLMAHYLTLILGLSMQEIETIMSIICFAISIILGIITIVIKLKAYWQDGQLSKEEINDLVEQVNKIQEEIKEKKNGNN